MSRGIIPTSEIPVVTKTKIRQMYFLGLILSKVISKSKIHSMVGKYQFNNQENQKEISAVIEMDTTLNIEITQSKNSECNCEKENTADWYFPVICSVLLILHSLLSFLFNVLDNPALDVWSYNIFLFARHTLQCGWAVFPPLEVNQ
jgi:hypothetical protein